MIPQCGSPFGTVKCPVTDHRAVETVTTLSEPSARVPSQSNGTGVAPFSETDMGSVTHAQTSAVRVRGFESDEHGTVQENATGGAPGVGVTVGVTVGVIVGITVGV